MPTNQYDIIVVGGGGSGLAAAVAAAEQDADVLLLEKTPELGGTTGIAVGSFTANRTVYQQREGINDTADDHEEDAARFGPPEIQSLNNRELRRFFLEHANETLDWLTGMGLAFHGPSPEPPNRVPRMHNVVPNAKAYIARLHSRLLRFGGQIHCNCPVEELVRNEGRVVGRRGTAEGRSDDVSSQTRRRPSCRRLRQLARNDRPPQRPGIHLHRGYQRLLDGRWSSLG